jgi:hypothetical protein
MKGFVMSLEDSNSEASTSLIADVTVTLAPDDMLIQISSKEWWKLMDHYANTHDPIGNEISYKLLKEIDGNGKDCKRVC